MKNAKLAEYFEKHPEAAAKDAAAETGTPLCSVYHYMHKIGAPMKHYEKTGRRCWVCRQVLPLADFVKNRQRPKGYEYLCKACKRQRRK